MQNTLPAVKAESTLLDMNEVAGMKLPDAEAAVTLELDRIREVAAADPLEGLDQVVGLMQSINMELMKCYAPVVLENARISSDEFQCSGQIVDDKCQGSRTYTAFLRLQETVTKLGVAHVKVRDEKDRRTMARVKT